MKFIESIESELGIKAKKNFREMQAGDVYKTFADTQDLFAATGYKPSVSVKVGVAELVSWYKAFYLVD
jgi:UDP-glucuronate 4-epimerase